MRKPLIWALALSLAASACNKGVDDDATDDTDTDTDTNSQNDGFTPYVEKAMSFATTRETPPESFWNWLVYANDEQGRFTIKSLNKLGAYTAQRGRGDL